MIEAILKGIFDLENASNPFKTAIGGRFYLGEAPQDTAYPYCIYEQISGVPDRTFTDKYEDILLQFTLVDSSDSIATIADAETKMYTLFDDAVLTVTGYTSVTLDRVSSVLVKKGLEIDDNITYWNIIATYRILVEAN